jgi:hypothetical protein
LTGITPGFANEWEILTDAQVGVLNTENTAENDLVAGSRPPNAENGTVVQVYVAEQVTTLGARRAFPKLTTVNVGDGNIDLAHINAPDGQTPDYFVGELLYQPPPEKPYIRTGFKISQHEPLFSFPSGFSVFPEVSQPFSVIPKYFPMLVQDSKHFFRRSTSEVNRCIRCAERSDDGGRLSATLVDSCELGFYLNDDVQQSEKMSSTINQPLPRIEKYSKLFSTGEKPVVSFRSQYGMPEYLFIRIKQLFSRPPAVEKQHYCGRIDSISMVVQQYDCSLFKSQIDHKQLRELTRQNSNVLSEEQEYTVLLSVQNFGPMGFPKENENIDFTFTLNAFDQHYNCTDLQKEFIVCPIYLGREALQGTTQNISIQKFFK